MQNSVIIEIALALVLVWALMSLVIAIFRNFQIGASNLGGRNVEAVLAQLLCAPNVGNAQNRSRLNYDLLKQFYDHPLISAVYNGRYQPPSKKRPSSLSKRLPVAIAPQHFGYVVLDLLSAQGAGLKGVGDSLTAKILAACTDLPNQDLADKVRFAISSGGGNIDKAQQILAHNYISAMQIQVKKSHKSEQKHTFAWVMIACIAFNINSLVIADKLNRGFTSNAGLATSVDQISWPVGWDSGVVDTMKGYFKVAAPHELIGNDIVRAKRSPRDKGLFPDLSLAVDRAYFSAEAVALNVIDAYNDVPILGYNSAHNALSLLGVILGWFLSAAIIATGAGFGLEALANQRSRRSRFVFDSNCLNISLNSKTQNAVEPKSDVLSVSSKDSPAFAPIAEVVKTSELEADLTLSKRLH